MIRPFFARSTIRDSISCCSSVWWPPNFPQSIFSAFSGRDRKDLLAGQLVVENNICRFDHVCCPLREEPRAARAGAHKIDLAGHKEIPRVWYASAIRSPARTRRALPLYPRLFKCPDLLFYTFCPFSIKREDFGDQVPVPAVDTHGGKAPGTYLFHHGPLNRDVLAGLRVIECGEQFHNRGICPAHHRDGALVGGRDELLRGQALARDPDAQP